MIKVLAVVGTRPEVIKMAPVIREITAHSDSIRLSVCATAQHREMLDQMLAMFDLRPDYDLDIMQEGQSLASLSSRVFTAAQGVLADVGPDWVLVQGDTTTAMIMSLVAFYHNVKVGHVEAGLRTGNKRAPFPEEINRRIISVVGDMHFAPTDSAREALLAENIPASIIRVTGNTVIDALFWVRNRVRERPPRIASEFAELFENRRVILVTGHRRENFGEAFEQICEALREIVRLFPDVDVVYPVHLNPNVREPVHRLLGDSAGRIRLTEPQPYDAFVWLMDRSYLVLTDSGGVQEEAPSLGKPTLVMRETTERKEGIRAGNTILVGTTCETIVEYACRLLNDPDQYRRMAQPSDLYGDGKAGSRIVREILEYRGI